jgi:hypothetical protein
MAAMWAAPKPGESARLYIRRMHRGACICPTAYSMCKWSVIYRAFYGDTLGPHGGWGWEGPKADAAKLRSSQ